MPAEIQIDGLRRFQAGLKKIDPELAKDMKTEFVGVANRVAGDARSRVPSRTGRAAASLRGGSTTKGAYVAGGRSTVPYYGWLDFGRRTPKSGQPRSVGPWARTGAGPKRGRFIYPAIDANKTTIEREAARIVNDVSERVLPK